MVGTLGAETDYCVSRVDTPVPPSPYPDSNDRDASPSVNASNLPDEPLPHEWTCPYCDHSRVITANSESVDESIMVDRAVKAIRAHVLASVGDGHGEKNAFPDGFDTTSVHEHVHSLTN